MKQAVFRRANLICSSLLVVSLTGCATMSSVARFDDRSDPCYSLRKPLIETESQLGQKMAVGGFIGAVGGAGAAAVAGGNATQTILAAIVGGIAGASVGYYQGMQQKQLTQAQMMGEIYSDAQVDARRVSQTRGLIGNLNQCRNRQIDEIELDYRTGRINRNEMVSRASAIRAASLADNELISTVLGKANERTQTYVDAATRAQQVSSDAVLGDIAGFHPVSSGVLVDASGPASLLSTVATASGQVQGKEPLVAARPSPEQPYVATQSSNVRSAPSRSAGVVGGLMAGQKVAVQQVHGDWAQIAFNGQSAYVHATLVAPDGSDAARMAQQAARQQRAVALAPPKPTTPVQEVVLENRLAEAEAAADQQRISSRLNDLMLLGGQGAA